MTARHAQKRLETEVYAVIEGQIDLLLEKYYDASLGNDTEQYKLSLGFSPNKLSGVYSEDRLAIFKAHSPKVETYLKPRIHNNMASHLASIFGTEQDRVNCSFYYKIGACRHGDRCSRRHQKPVHSQTILLSNVYQNPGLDPQCTLTDEELQDDFDAFYEDMFMELAQFGNLLEIHICDNVGDHLVGNVYARYEWEVEAGAAVANMNDRWYQARPLWAELSPVTDFREACCRQNETGDCNRGGLCNFLHVRLPSPRLASELRAGQRLEREINPKDSLIDENAGWVPGKRATAHKDARDDRDRSRSPARSSVPPSHTGPPADEEDAPLYDRPWDSGKVARY
ncbi:rna-binding domain-containing protein [Phaffia rhodozyma]|uniref:Rna-binding domain-containing protein n=1 Tax=Phaffia rhodozyma TaxID=264483 RepID=A0A0F7SKQ7_PHARH|nr:rna-binding domain-containing protein [Phaffia rhodozyma]